MTTLYKLTDANGYTRAGKPNALLWGEGVTHTATGEGVRLCSDGVIHAYIDPILAVLLNPIHAALQNPIIWAAEGEIVTRDGQLKVGVKTLTTTSRIDLPNIKTEQRVRFAIYCAQAVIGDTSPKWSAWADRWLSGEDRSEAAAWAAWAEAAAAAAARAARAAAAWAAWEARARAAAAEAAAEVPTDIVALARKAVEAEK